jgi:hypothetical protein
MGLILLSQNPTLQQKITNSTLSLLNLKRRLSPTHSHFWLGKEDFIITWNQYNLFLANNPVLPIGNGQTKNNFLVILRLFGYYWNFFVDNLKGLLGRDQGIGGGQFAGFIEGELERGVLGNLSRFKGSVGGCGEYWDGDVSCAGVEAVFEEMRGLEGLLVENFELGKVESILKVLWCARMTFVREFVLKKSREGNPGAQVADFLSRIVLGCAGTGLLPKAFESDRKSQKIIFRSRSGSQTVGLALGLATDDSFPRDYLRLYIRMQIWVLGDLHRTFSTKHKEFLTSNHGLARQTYQAFFRNISEVLTLETFLQDPGLIARTSIWVDELSNLNSIAENLQSEISLFRTNLSANSPRNQNLLQTPLTTHSRAPKTQESFDSLVSLLHRNFSEIHQKLRCVFFGGPEKSANSQDHNCTNEKKLTAAILATVKNLKANLEKDGFLPTKNYLGFEGGFPNKIFFESCIKFQLKLAASAKDNPGKLGQLREDLNSVIKYFFTLKEACVLLKLNGQALEMSLLSFPLCLSWALLAGVGYYG